MHIEKIHIYNYRNLNDVEIHFHPLINFIVGENNLGKSNLLDCLNTLFNWRGFKEDDFTEREEPIKIFLTLGLKNEEIGVFEDYFNPEDSSKINLKIIQDNPDSYLLFYHKESDDKIPHTWRRCANYIKYGSLRTPKDELSFDKNKGVGKFLSHMVEVYLNNREDEFPYIKNEEMEDLIDFINNNLNKIKIFKEYSINADIDNELENLLYKMLVLKENDVYDLKHTGHGIQYFAMVSLLLLEKIIKLTEYKKSPIPIFDKSDGTKAISAILGLDEPEIHLHPYMERSLTKYMLNILNDKDSDFLSVTKNIFDIGSINGQAIMVTHSPNIILNDYHQVIRFCESESNNNKVISGTQINLSSSIEKQLLRNMPYVKEAFFSRCVILCEGDTELAALPLFAEKLDINLDLYGITIIKSDGKKSIPKLAKLFKKFNIKVCAIMDKDNEENNYNFPNEITEGKDFEEDLVDTLIDNGNISSLFEIFDDYDNRDREERYMQENKLKKINNKYGIIEDEIEQGYRFSEIAEDENISLLKLMFITWFDINKSTILGRVIGEKIKNENIPEKYKQILLKSRDLSKE